MSTKSSAHFYSPNCSFLAARYNGYKLTSEIRNDPRMKSLFITLNTSLSGSFNEAMVQKVGCDRFISKFQPDLLVQVAQDRLRDVLS